MRDIENTYLALESTDASAMDDLLGHSISYRIAVGPHAGRKAFTLQTIPAREDGEEDGKLAKASGFSLHAGVATQAHQRRKLERLCRYIARPAVSTGRMALTRQGNVRYMLKTPYRDGTTPIILESLDFIAHLAALVPKPRVNLTRFHGVFAPNSRIRSQVTPGGRGKQTPDEIKTPAQCHAAMTWAQRLKRVYGIDIETCDKCGGRVKVIACIEDPVVIRKVLYHLEQRANSTQPPPLAPSPDQP